MMDAERIHKFKISLSKADAQTISELVDVIDDITEDMDDFNAIIRAIAMKERKQFVDESEFQIDILD